MKKISISLILVIIHSLTCLGQGVLAKKNGPPENERNCFRYFDANATGRNDINAYLLSYLSRIVYPQYLDSKLKPTDTSAFKAKFIQRTKHFFSSQEKILSTQDLKSSSNSIKEFNKQNYSNKIENDDDDVNYSWIWRSDGVGKDPEAMVISTSSTIYVVFRGTDRVVGTDFGGGEWIFTNFNPFPQKPCNNCLVRVHRGFLENLNYGGFRTDLVNTIKKYGGQSKKIWITGHSLGGGLAQLFGYLLKKIDNIQATGIYVYNSPHPGDVDFATEMDLLFTNGRLQRFEFLDDPISQLPPQSGGSGRAGVRNYFEKETLGGYKYNTKENSLLKEIEIPARIAGALPGAIKLETIGGICFHHPTWITRALHNLIPPNIQTNLPFPPERITANDEACNTIDINNGVSGKLYDGGTDIIPEGNYRIKNVKSDRFIRASDEGFFNCNKLDQISNGSGDNTKWKVSKVKNAIFESYTFKSSLSSKVFDADIFNTKLKDNNDACKVQLCERLPTPPRTNQEWTFEKLPNGNYRIKCVQDGGYLSVGDCYSQDGCKFELKKEPKGQQSEWKLISIK